MDIDDSVKDRHNLTGIKCECGSTDFKVTHSRKLLGFKRRYLKCKECGKTIRTHERQG